MAIEYTCQHCGTRYPEPVEQCACGSAVGVSQSDEYGWYPPEVAPTWRKLDVWTSFGFMAGFSKTNTHWRSTDNGVLVLKDPPIAWRWPARPPQSTEFKF